MSHHHLFRKILSRAHSVPASVPDLGKQGDKGRQSPVIKEPALAFGATDTKQKNRIMNARKAEKTGYCANELGVTGAPVNEAGQEEVDIL